MDTDKHTNFAHSYKLRVTSCELRVKRYLPLANFIIIGAAPGGHPMVPDVIYETICRSHLRCDLLWQNSNTEAIRSRVFICVRSPCPNGTQEGL